MNPNHPAASRGSAGARRNRAAFRNEVKTRLDDLTYEALQRYQAIHGIESTSAAMQRALRMSLLGVIGMLPPEISGVSADLGEVGTVP
ncbi:protein of unknown function [Pararobbsia alpina]|uniref:hypothetical protein n=1 Tax=Pararobbsia alpina TaxID=621374 RepID=UPI0039A4B364